MVLRLAKQSQISFGCKSSSVLHTASQLQSNLIQNNVADCDTVTGQRVYPAPAAVGMTDLLPEQEPPQQKEASTSAAADHGHQPRISSWPPLGQATTITRHRHSVKFTILLESNTDSLSASQPGLEVQIWHNHNGEHEWNELPLSPASDQDDVFIVHESSVSNHSKRSFTAILEGLPKHAHVVSFTVRYRTASSKEWHWARDSTGIEDGQLHYLAPADFTKHSTYDLDHFFSGISSDIKVESKSPETDDTQLWELTCPVSATHSQDSGYQHHRLGKVKRSSKWFALVRLWAPWLAPRHGKGGHFELDKDGILLSFLREDGLNVVILGISGLEDIVTTFIHDEDLNIVIKGRNDRESNGTSRVLVAVAESFEVANCAVFYHARRVIEQYGSSSASTEIEAIPDTDVKPEWLEEWYDGLAYCTWNGLGQNLTAASIHRALDELAKHEISITNLIIDDNWQTLSHGNTQFKRGWSEFEANKEGFPDGLKGLTTEIRKRHQNIVHIAVWHAMLGYWGAIDPNGKIASDYKTREAEMEAGVAGGKFTVVDGEDAGRMYDDFYRFLSDSGIDSAKTDAQNFLDMLQHAPDRRNIITQYQDAWTIAHLRHFSSRAISCMSQIPQALFHTQLPQNKPKVLLRNNDDFFPEVDASHPWHIFCNAHNSLFTQHLNVLPDWDMFQTSHQWASFHAAARCVSGGPIYITDVPGQHDIKLIGQMTGQTPRGKTVILRPSCIGKTINAYNGYSAQAFLKVGTYNGTSGAGAGILGVFNVSQQHVSELFNLDSFPGTEKGDYVILSFAFERIPIPIPHEKYDKAIIGISLPPRGWDILTAFPAQLFTVHGKSFKVAVLGILGKMTGCAAVTSSRLHVESNGRLRVSVTLKVLGVLGLWVSDLETRSLEKDFMVALLNKPIPFHCVEKGKENLLKIDIERAWIEMGETAGWSNEVVVDIFIG